MDPNIYEACSDLIVKFKGPVSADEVLAEKINHLVPIPLPSPEEISAITKGEVGADYDLLPSIDLKVLHYFLTQLVVQKYPHLINCFDETSLIALGVLLEEWVQEYLEDANNEIRKGPALVIGKNTNYRDSPANI
ncbi:HFR047Wp [Eremothecium sinecaudum]|uniref:HFR047Wp n=1 Tax=Eremothecium sinecaudum TaxID=45286 RepID=A0A120K2L4_9SACH|nr:HFR047Wp [Eremothecium sinecaudum]AMD21902.1 HFR047Wp [Eremothecium sinecaudum]